MTTKEKFEELKMRDINAKSDNCIFSARPEKAGFCVPFLVCNFLI